MFRLELLERYLVPASLVYLALPYVIFYIGWLQWYWAVLGIGVLAVALIESTRLVLRQTVATGFPPENSPYFTSRHLLVLLLISFVWLSLAGVGGIGYQRGDWLKHESVLKDLIEHSWPVVYDFYAVPVPLVYYLAFYLPAALVGKMAGWAVAQFTLFVWTYLGLNLAMLWFWLLVSTTSSRASSTASHTSYKAAFPLFFTFVVFSGLDVIGNLITGWVGDSMGGWERIERWGQDLEYSANTVLLYWVPNQALAGWIAGGVTLYAILHMRERRITSLSVALSTLWSPFVTIGLVPYLVAEFLSDEGSLLIRLRRYFTWSSLCGLLLMLLMGIFYLSKLYEISPYTRGEIPHGFYFATETGSPLGPVGSLVTFWLVEVGIFAVLLFPSMKSEERLWRWLFATTGVYLTLLPLYKVGIYNDLVMRASIPALFCLAILVGRALHRHALGLPTRITLIIALLLGAGTTVLESIYQISGIYRAAMGLPHEELMDTRGIVEVYWKASNHLLQYVGGYESPFFWYFANEQDWTGRSSEQRYIAFADQRILFEGYDLEKDSALQPGEQVQMINRMYVFYEAIDKNYNISLRLVSEDDGKEIWRDQGWPQNRPTSIWAPSLLWYDTRTLTIPVDTPAGIYRLDLSFVDPETHDLLPAVAVPTGRYMGEMVPIGYVTVGEVESRPSFSFPQPAQLDAKVALIGITPAPEQVASQVVSQGASLSLELFWQAIAEMDRDYTGFVHLLDADGHLVAQHDHRPRNGFLPTSIWKNSLVIADGYTLLVPQDASPGTYTLVAGMYDLETGVRLPVWQDGKSIGDSLLIAHVYVE